MRQSWTDDRMDDLSREMNRRFDEVDRRFDKVDRRFEKAEKDVNRRFDKVDRGMSELRTEFAALNRTLVQTGGAIFATLVGGIVAAMVAFAITQL